MRAFECQSGKAILQESRNGVIEVNYYGVLTRDSLCQLKQRILDATSCAPALVIRFDKALIIASDVATPPGYDSQRNIPTAALIVRQENFDMWADYSHRVALVGVMRAVFLTSQAPLAYRWAEAHALVARSISPRSQHCKQPFV